MSMMGLIGDRIVAAPVGVQVDQAGTPHMSGSLVTSYDYTGLNITSGLTNSALVVSVLNTDSSGTPTGLTATWDNTGTPQSMTLVGSANHSTVAQLFIALFALKSPNPGIGKTLHLAWTGAATVAVGAISLFNVNPATSFPTFNSANGTSAGPASVTITSATGRLVLCSMGTDQGYSANSGTLWSTYPGGGVTFGGRGSYTPGAASVTPTGTLVASGDWLSVAMDVPN